VNLLHLRLSNEQGQAAKCRDQAGSNGEDALEVFDGAEGDGVGVTWLGREKVFGATGKYIDICQSNGPGDLTQEGGLLVVGLDQGEVEVRGPDLDGQARKASTGTDVDEMLGEIPPLRKPRRLGHSRKQGTGGEKRLAEVAGDDLFWVADGSQADAGVPAKQ